MSGLSETKHGQLNAALIKLGTLLGDDFEQAILRINNDQNFAQAIAGAMSGKDPFVDFIFGPFGIQGYLRPLESIRNPWSRMEDRDRVGITARAIVSAMKCFPLSIKKVSIDYDRVDYCLEDHIMSIYRVNGGFTALSIAKRLFFQLEVILQVDGRSFSRAATPGLKRRLRREAYKEGLPVEEVLRPAYRDTAWERLLGQLEPVASGLDSSWVLECLWHAHRLKV